MLGSGLAGGTGQTFGHLLVSAALVPSLLACVVVLLIPPRRDEHGTRGSWRALLRVGLALWGVVLAVVVLAFALFTPAWAQIFATFGATLPVPTQWLLDLTVWLTAIGWLTGPLTLGVEAGAPLVMHLALRRLPADWDWVVVVGAGLVLALFTATIGVAVWLPLLTISQAIGP